MPTLRPFLDFDPVETPLSFATRLAKLHTGGPRGPFLNDIGIKLSDLAGGDPCAVGRLSAVAGIDPAERATEMLGVLVAFGPRKALRSPTEADWDRAGRDGYAFTAAGEDGNRAALEHVRKGP